MPHVRVAVNTRSMGPEALGRAIARFPRDQMSWEGPADTGRLVMSGPVPSTMTIGELLSLSPGGDSLVMFRMMDARNYREDGEPEAEEPVVRPEPPEPDSEGKRPFKPKGAAAPQSIMDHYQRGAVFSEEDAILWVMEDGYKEGTGKGALKFLVDHEYVMPCLNGGYVFVAPPPDEGIQHWGPESDHLVQRPKKSS